MAVRWTISFKTLSGSDGLINIYDSTYNGAAIALAPAANPISVSCRQSEYITPIVSDSGYLRIIDDGSAGLYLDQLHPQGSLDRPVEFFIDGTLVWRGYISPETFTDTWEPAPREVDLPLVGILDALKSVNITDTGVGLQTIAGFFLEIMAAASGHDFEGVQFIQQMKSVNSHTDAPEMRLKLSRFNFLSLNDAEYQDDPDWTEFVGESYYSVLEKICQYFGWTASVEGKRIMLTTSRRDLTIWTYITSAAMQQIENGAAGDVSVTTDTRSVKSGLDFDGINHRRSLRNGKRRITITTSTPKPEGIYPEILFNGGVEYDGQNVFAAEFHPTGVDHDIQITGRNKVLDISRDKVTLHKYEVTDIGQTGESYHEVTWNYPASVNDMVGPGAYVVKSFSDGWVKEDGNVVDGSDSQTVKETFKNTLRLTGNKGVVSGQSTTKHFTTNVLLATIKSRAICHFAPGGCICINANIQDSFFRLLTNVAGQCIDPSGMSMWGAWMDNLKCSLRVGNKYYDGTQWVDNPLTPPLFDVNCHPEYQTTTNDRSKNGVGKIMDRIEIKIPSPKATGYVVPVDTPLEGYMELSFYNWDYVLPPNQGASGNCFVSIYISDLMFSYYNGSDDEEKQLRLSRLTGRDYQDSLEVNLSLSSNNDNRISQACLWIDDSKMVGGNNQLLYSGFLQLTQPEDWLMSTMLTLYSTPSERLEIEISYIPTLNKYDFVAVNGRRYTIQGFETDYASEHTKLYIETYL